MLNLDQIKITRRDQQVLDLLVQGCSNKDIAAELEISPRTVKQHLRTLFLRAGIKQGRKRVILATAIFEKEQMKHVATRTTELRGIRIATLVWQRTNPEIARVVGSSEQLIKNHLRNIFDKLGVWSHLELALYVASHGGTRWSEPLAAEPSSVAFTAATAGTAS